MGFYAVINHVKSLLSVGGRRRGTLRCEECGCEMVRISRFTTMRSKYKGVEVASFAPGVETCHVGEEVVDVIAIWRILFCIPLFWRRVFPIQSTFDFAFVVDRVETYYSLEEDV
jgi:hypothetical protein